eukprot:Skav207528  [mRNA]  locus=scaffold907:419280:422105:+ [translate_table: standard]
MEVDYVFSFEVPEHIAPEHEDELVQTLTQAKVAIVVSWALLGQAGHGHINEHSQSYVIRQLEKRSFHYCPSLSHDLARGMDRRNRPWEYRNLVVLVSEQHLDSLFCELPLRDFAIAEAWALLFLGLVLLYVLRESLVVGAQGTQGVLNTLPYWGSSGSRIKQLD